MACNCKKRRRTVIKTQTSEPSESFTLTTDDGVTRTFPTKLERDAAEVRYNSKLTRF